MPTHPHATPVCADPCARSEPVAAARPFLVRLSGEQTGRHIDLREGETLLGRGEEADVRLEGHGISRLHAALKVGPAGVVLFDLGSANRSHVNGRAVADAVTLQDGDLVQLAGVLLRFHDRRSLNLTLQARVDQLVASDPASGALTRRALHAVAERAFAQATARGRPLVLLGCGLDHFERLRARHGPDRADALLRPCAQLLRDQLPEPSALGRWGAEEFMAVVGDAQLEDGLQLAERMRLAVAAQAFELQVPVRGRLRQLLHRQTVSIGLAVLRPGVRDVHDLQAAADRRLYAARRDGGNRVSAVDPPA